MKDDRIHVRQYAQTYIARWRGKTASCTAGPWSAARAVVKKVLGEGRDLWPAHAAAGRARYAYDVIDAPAPENS